MAFSYMTVIIKKEQGYLQSSILHTNTHFVNPLDTAETEQKNFIPMGLPNSDFDHSDCFLL